MELTTQKGKKTEWQMLSDVATAVDDSHASSSYGLIALPVRHKGHCGAQHCSVYWSYFDSEIESASEFEVW